MWERTFSTAIHMWTGEKNIFLCSSVMCVKEEYVKAPAMDLISHLHLDNGKYKESGLGSS
jgi:hypothetical protein